MNVDIKVLQDPCFFNQIFEEKSKSFGIRSFFQICQIGDMIVKQSFKTDMAGNNLRHGMDNDYKN